MTVVHPRHGRVEVLQESPLFLQIEQHGHAFWFPKKELTVEVQEKAKRTPKAKPPLTAAQEEKAKRRAEKIAARTPQEAEDAKKKAAETAAKCAATRESNLTPSQRYSRQLKADKKTAAAKRRRDREARKEIQLFTACTHLNGRPCSKCLPHYNRYRELTGRTAVE